MPSDNSPKAKSAGEIQLDTFLRDMETESGVKKWAEGAYEEAQRSNKKQEAENRHPLKK